MTRKLLYTIALTIGLLVFLGAPVALAQASRPHTRPPVLPQDQAPLPDRPGQEIQDRVAPFPPDQNQTVATSPAPAMSTLADTQSRVQEALQRDMPGSGIQVSVTDNGSLQLTGSVPTSDQKRRAEDIARSMTNNQSIVNKITVRGEQAPDQAAVPR